jgi:hypothetical protein
MHAGLALLSRMQERAAMLRRRIALYRRYLREGVDVALAGEYVRQLLDDEAELAAIEAGEPRS